MIKRWIARRRRRLDLYGRVRELETRLQTVLTASASLADRQAGRLVDLESAVEAVAQRLQAAEDAAHGLKDDIDRSHRSLETARKQDLAPLSVRLGRLEAQRQLDIEEARKTASASIVALKGAVLSWRSQTDSLADIDRILPSQNYVGRPSEDARPIRLRPSLVAGVPLSQAGLSERVHVVSLAPDGSPMGETLRADMTDDSWVAYAPLGSLLSPDFGHTVLEHAAEHPDVAIFYGDDFAVDTEEAIDQLFLKPDFDLTLLCGQDYVGFPLVVRVSALRALGDLDRGRATAAGSDLLFRAHARGMPIRRIPKVLLAHPGARVRSTVPDYRAMLRAQPALAAYEILPGLTLNSFRLARRFEPAEQEAVSVLIPTRRAKPQGSIETYIERLLSSLTSTDWPMDRLNIIVGDDIGDTPEWATRRWPFKLTRVETRRGPLEPFNYAAKMNGLWRQAQTEQLVFMNDDVRALDGGWLKALQTFAMDPGVGGVGARLLFEDGSLQHAGMAPHRDGAAHLWIQRQGSKGAYQGWPLIHREWSMVTGAIFATRRSLMEQVAGFDERFSLEFNDTDLCLRLRSAGYRIVATPFAQMVHVERASRRGAAPPEADVRLFNSRWSKWLEDDPSWHPDLDRTRIEVVPMPAPDAWYR